MENRASGVENPEAWSLSVTSEVDGLGLEEADKAGLLGVQGIISGNIYSMPGSADAGVNKQANISPSRDFELEGEKVWFVG